jgi:hypothetical protein
MGLHRAPLAHRSSILVALRNGLLWGSWPIPPVPHALREPCPNGVHIADTLVGGTGLEEPDELANLMYIGVLAAGVTGAFVARFRSREMARALFATALAKASVAVIALIFGLGSGSPPGVLGILILNGFFVSLFVGSACRAGANSRGRGAGGLSRGHVRENRA